MREILQETAFAASILGVQRGELRGCRPSQYCLRTECEDGILLYHTLTGALLLLEPGDNEAALQRELFRRHFLVPDTLDEYELASQLRHVACLMQPPAESVTSFLLFPTTDCNARCFYCYELGRSRVSMSDKTARDVAEYIARVSHGEPVRLSWFGGEPLFNRPAIDIICSELETHGIHFRSRMVSNAYLFDSETVHFAREKWNLYFIQVTLDGTEEIYNRSKAFIYHDGSAYQRVLQNVGLLLDSGIRVDLRLNLNRENFEDLMRLCDELALRFPNRKNLRVYTVLLRDFGHDVRPFLRSDDAVQSYETLRQYIRDKGLGQLSMLKRGLPVNQCMADSDRSITILPDGRLGKCEHETERNLVGSIYEGVTDPDMLASWKQHLSLSQCRGCLFYPGCLKVKKCPWHAAGCTDFIRRVRLSDLRERVLCAYQQQRDHIEERFTEEDLFTDYD